MAGAAAMFFGFPLVTAVIGAALAGSSSTAQFVGGVTGMVSGAIVACLAGRLINRRCEAQS